MENIKNKINKMFYKFINKKKHPFFNDIYNVNEKAGDYIMYQQNFITEKIDYKENKSPNPLIIKKTEKNKLTKDDLIRINKELKQTMTMISIYKIVSKISEYIIPENIPKDMKKPNILIIGSGPIGLFISCYIKKYYGSKYNVILYDNYIEKPGFKKPYNRYRPFQTKSSYLSLIIPKLYCLTNKDYIYVNIFLLEYLLYSQAILKYNIPIIYKDYKWDDYKKIIDENNVKFVFDCSGGRLKTNVFKNIDISWLTTDKKDILLKKELDINIKENIVKLKDTSGSFIKNHYYGSLNIYYKDLRFYNKFDIDINSIIDLKYLNNIKKKYYSLDSIKIIVRGIKDKINRNFLYNVLIDRDYIDYIFKIDVWTINIRHTLQLAELVNDKCLYIKAGDSMFHSHFITGAGLNRTIDFAVKCVHYLEF
jgi:hypothetical protein